jgi:S1-C subfamily serine protease
MNIISKIRRALWLTAFAAVGSLVISSVFTVGLLSYKDMTNDAPALVAPAELIHHSLTSTVRVGLTNEPSWGSGVILHKFGRTYVITAAHVVDAAGLTNHVDVQLYNSTNRYPAKVINIGKDIDIALLRVLGTNLLGSSVRFPGTLDPLPIGAKIVHVGNWRTDPFSFTTGIVNAQNRADIGMIFDQTSTTVFAGSSGGGIWDSNGLLQGILSRSGHSDLNYYVPTRFIYYWAHNNELYWIFN